MDVEDIEIDLLLKGIFRGYGFDFRGYARASLRRRVLARLKAEGVRTVSALQDKVLHDADCLERLVEGISVHVTSMFGDPQFYRSLRQNVLPFLSTYPYPRLWLAGCSTGEEVYSIAIVLEEAGLLRRCRVYATDLSDRALHSARQGQFPLSAMQGYTRNYLEAGGTRSFSDYYTSDHARAVFRSSLRDNVVFARHNLVTDGPFNEFHTVICRNVLIYFGRPLADRVHRLLYESLAPLGVIGLGRKESIGLTPYESHYEIIDAAEKLYRKVR